MTDEKRKEEDARFAVFLGDEEKKRSSSVVPSIHFRRAPESRGWPVDGGRAACPVSIPAKQINSL